MPGVLSKRSIDLVLTILFVAYPAQALIGNLNCDGKVEFFDFFIFSDNFNSSSETTTIAASGRRL